MNFFKIFLNFKNGRHKYTSIHHYFSLIYSQLSIRKGLNKALKIKAPKIPLTS
nr:MAG TPA: hypothetical protein [Caudoviricetes sp.]